MNPLSITQVVTGQLPPLPASPNPETSPDREEAKVTPIKRDVYKAAKTTQLSQLDLAALNLPVPGSIKTEASPKKEEGKQSPGVDKPGKDKVEPKGKARGRDKLDSRGQEAYDKLEKSGKLKHKDKNGVCLDDHIDQAVNAVPGPWMVNKDTKSIADPAALVGELLINLLDPALIFQGSETDTCTASAAQQILAACDPSEYFRIAMDLATTGTTSCRGGQALRIDEQAFGSASGRTAISDAFQGSLMLLGRSFDPGEGNGEIGGLSRTSRQVSYAGDGTSRGSGLTETQFNRLIDAISGRDYVTVDSSPDRMDAMFSHLQKALSTAPVAAFLNPPDGSSIGHAVTITEIKRGQVSFWDPGLGQASSMRQDFMQSLLGGINLPASSVARDKALRDAIRLNA